MGPRDQQDQSVPQDPLDFQVFLVHLQAHPDVMALWDPLEPQETKALQEILDHPVPQVSPVLQVSQLPPVVQALVQWSVLTHVSDPAHRHVAVAKCLKSRESSHVAAFKYPKKIRLRAALLL